MAAGRSRPTPTRPFTTKSTVTRRTNRYPNSSSRSATAQGPDRSCFGRRMPTCSEAPRTMSRSSLRSKRAMSAHLSRQYGAISPNPAPTIRPANAERDDQRTPPTPGSSLVASTSHSRLAPKFRSGSMSATRRPVGFAAAPPVRGRNWPEPASTDRLPSATTVRPRDSTVIGQPRTVRPANGV